MFFAHSVHFLSPLIRGGGPLRSGGGGVNSVTNTLPDYHHKYIVVDYKNVNGKKMPIAASVKKIATVNANGKVTGVKKGKATVYAYAQNGIFKAVKVTVK